MLSSSFLKLKGSFGLGTIAGQGWQDVIVDVLRECLQMKLDIDQSWYHLPLEFFE